MAFFTNGMMRVLDNRATNEQHDIADEVTSHFAHTRHATREDVYYITLDLLTDEDPMITCATDIDMIIECVDACINEAVCAAYDD